MSILLAADFSQAEWVAWWPALQSALPGETLVREVANPLSIEIAQYTSGSDPSPPARSLLETQKASHLPAPS